jgi:hypothetical protein
MTYYAYIHTENGRYIHTYKRTHTHSYTHIHTLICDMFCSAVVMTSVERAIEVLAAMVGKTHVKEEIVHGSYRLGLYVCMK